MSTTIHKFSNGFVDLHTHILPGIDDGAADIHTSYEMLLRLKQQNVTTVVLTPHFYTDKERKDDFFLKRNQAYQKLLPVAAEIGINIIPGCELFFTDYVFNNQELKTICINQKKYILTEFPFSFHMSSNFLDKISRFIGTYSVRPILAHIDRYPQLYKDRDSLMELIDMGCITQINLESLTSGYLRQKMILRLIKDGLVHVIGTDCHNTATRPPAYKDGVEIIEKRLGKNYVDLLMQNSIDVIYK